MKDSFFTRPAKKRPGTKLAPKVKPKKTQRNDDVSSESDEEEYELATGRKRFKEYSDDEDAAETAQEKKIRLAKQYLAEIEREEKDKADADQIDRSVIANRLRDEVLEKEGRLLRKVAEQYQQADLSNVTALKNGHKLPITCNVVDAKVQFVYTGSKDCCLIKWDLKTGKKVKVIQGGRKGSEETHKGHTGHILSIAISSDGRFLASGDDAKLIRIWNPATMELIHTFKGHRGPVTGLAFRKASHSLFSASHDRSVKVWNLDEMAYVETLFGHNEPITAIDSLMRERALTSGGRDSTVRMWKIIEESQLVFQSHGESVDCVKYLDEQHFISGGDDGSISLWFAQKKKPSFTLHKAHGMSGHEIPNWITSIATLVNTDLFATGSQDGKIRLWKTVNDNRKFEPLFTIDVKGFINCIEFTANGDHLVASVGQEHRLGRWWRLKDAKNQILIIPLVKE